jgi:hypothetical protein
MRKDWRLFVFWLGVGVAGIAIWLSWWAVSGFQVPICQEMSSGASVTDHCLSYDEIRAWGAQITRGRTHYRSIHPKFARYHEQAGNEAG